MNLNHWATSCEVGEDESTDRGEQEDEVSQEEELEDMFQIWGWYIMLQYEELHI